MCKASVKNVMVGSLAGLLLTVGVATAMELKPSVFELERHKLRYESMAQLLSQNDRLADAGEFSAMDVGNTPVPQHKSSAKAFFLSLAVPGLGQYYYGSKIKPLLFLSAEVVSWGLYATWHSDGNDLTDQYEAFNHAHWSRDDYEQKYLFWIYGVTDDDKIDSVEITHHLPDTKTQQFYEMTGKYDQFAWGWDDAELNGNTLDDFAADNPPPAITGESSTPYTARRLRYEEMRDDANNRYDRATRMIFVSLANHLISAFEAYFVTKNRNKQTQDDFTRLRVRAGLKSYHAKQDTPFLTVSYKL